MFTFNYACSAAVVLPEVPRIAFRFLHYFRLNSCSLLEAIRSTILSTHVYETKKKTSIKILDYVAPQTMSAHGKKRG